jgi:hypothetical protein
MGFLMRGILRYALLKLLYVSLEQKSLAVRVRAASIEQFYDFWLTTLAVDNIDELLPHGMSNPGRELRI